MAKLINHIMVDGKKNIAEKIVYSTFEKISSAENPATEVLKNAIEKLSPKMETRSRRIGGAIYQVPFPIKDKRSIYLSLKWIVINAQKRGEYGMVNKLANEIKDILSDGACGSIKKRDEVYKSCEANKAFAHYKW